MATINVGRENSADIDIHYDDLGSGPVVVLLHGWPFDSRSWEPQLGPLLAAGYRVITPDRRGFGRSSRPSIGYDFDTLSADVDALLTRLDLHDVALVGFSLGTGEVARYVGTAGTGRLRCAALVESLAPSFAKAPDNPDGVDDAAVGAVQDAILADRYSWLQAMMGNFLNLDDYLGKLVSEDTVHGMWNAGAAASPYATWACPRTWLEDFHADLERFDVATLAVHGTADRILSVDGQGHRLRDALPSAHYVEIEGGPHIHPVTHTGEFNQVLLDFLAGVVMPSAGDALAGHLQRTEIQRAASSVPGREIVQVRTDFPPGVSSGWHMHPGEEIGYIVAGTVRMEIEDAGDTDTVLLHAGDGFLIPPRVPHNATDLGPEAGQMLSTYLVETGEPLATLVNRPEGPS